MIGPRDRLDQANERAALNQEFDRVLADRAVIVGLHRQRLAADERDPFCVGRSGQVANPRSVSSIGLPCCCCRSGKDLREINQVLAIANRQVWKQVHNLVGLDKVFDTIIHLVHLNDPGVTGINPGTTWTMREIHGYFQQNGNAFYREALLPFGSAPSASDIIRRLHAAAMPQPLDPAVRIAVPSPIGLRQALNKFLQATARAVNVPST